MLRFSYSVSEGEVGRSVRDNKCVSRFLNKYGRGEITYTEKVVGIARFFCWSKVVKGLDLGPRGEGSFQRA
jgi:hypothetical protein